MFSYLKRRVFANTINLKIFRWEDNPGLFSWDLNKTINVLIRKWQMEIIQRHAEKTM